MVELPNHPWFVGCQFHPEFKSKPMSPHPLFTSFIESALHQMLGKKKPASKNIAPKVMAKNGKKIAPKKMAQKKMAQGKVTDTSKKAREFFGR